MMARHLDPFPAFPRMQCPEVRTALKYLKATHESITQLLETVDVLQRNRGLNGRGRPSTAQQDVMRAALALTTSGMESSMKQLVRDATPSLLERRPSNRAAYENFLREQLRSNGSSFSLERSVTSGDPTSDLVKFFVTERTSGSILSTKDLRRIVFDTLCISKRSVGEARLADLEPLLKARNHVVHDLDLLPRESKGNGLNRRSHRRSTVVDYVNLGVRFSFDVILHTAYLLREWMD